MTELLDARDPDLRSAAVHDLGRRLRDGEALFPPAGRDVNNHIHTTYSFSPYSPSRAVWEARRAGLATAGIMDHDTISGAREFLEVGRELGLPVTVGAELRVSFDGTRLAGRRINNPDQPSVAYLAFHGIPEPAIDALDDLLAPVRAARGERNRLMATSLDRMARELGVGLDYDRDVLPISESARGGSVTERHLLYALAVNLSRKAGSRKELLDLLEQRWDIGPSAKAAARIADEANPYFLYDLLGFFKAELLPRVYLPATSELLTVREALAFAEAHGIIAAYPYLGDVEDSVTGDKKEQRFEDGYLVELFDALAELGFHAVTYMPSRNTPDQLARLRALCDERGLFQISGEDINQPRQPFVCEAMRRPEFAPLHDAAWALIGHERKASGDLHDGMFSQNTIKRMPRIGDRIQEYSRFARSLYHL